MKGLGINLPGFDSFKSNLELPLTPVTPPPEYKEHSFSHNDKVIDISPIVDPNDQPLVAVIGVGYVGTIWSTHSLPTTMFSASTFQKRESTRSARSSQRPHPFYHLQDGLARSNPFLDLCTDLAQGR
ncbi:nucleotide sugar dehydrogenase [Colletotrichum tofieldiae]|nr:nucleotide sugar dehydrogenase [Colletotrichum tofieldiae]